MAGQTVNLRGEGGVNWTLSLPLLEVYADQVKKGLLVPADEESARILAGSVDTHGAAVAPRPPKVGTGSSREAWAAYAEARGLDVNGKMTRAQIIAAVEKGGADG